MDVEQQAYEGKKGCRKLRLRIVTNRDIQFLTSVKQDATISDLANRALSVYLELSGELLLSATKKQLTVAAVKQGVFYMPKSEFVSNLLCNDDQVEVVIIKAKPKYPHQMFKDEHPNKKNKTQNSEPAISKPDLTQTHLPEALLSEHPDPSMQDELNNTEINAMDRAREQSKRQKKKDKKHEKWEKKRDSENGDKDKKRDSKRDDSKEEKRGINEEIPLESLPKKKVKTEKEESHRSPERAIQKVEASPKITFHTEPKMDSPKVFNLSSEVQKKKPFFEHQATRVEGQSRKPSEDCEKKTPLQVIMSPGQPFKSPSLSQRVTFAVQQDINARQKQDLSNFQLSRKGSEDRRSQIRGKRPGEQKSILREFKPEIKETLESSTPHRIVVVQQLSKSHGKKMKPQVRQEMVAEVPAKVEEKPKKSLLIIQPASDSDSEQNKNANNWHHLSSREKELTQLKSRIQSFLIDSDEDE